MSGRGETGMLIHRYAAGTGPALTRLDRSSDQERRRGLIPDEGVPILESGLQCRDAARIRRTGCQIEAGMSLTRQTIRSPRSQNRSALVH